MWTKLSGIMVLPGSSAAPLGKLNVQRGFNGSFSVRCRGSRQRIIVQHYDQSLPVDRIAGEITASSQLPSKCVSQHKAEQQVTLLGHHKAYFMGYDSAYTELVRHQRSSNASFDGPRLLGRLSSLPPTTLLSDLLQNGTYALRTRNFLGANPCPSERITSRSTTCKHNRTQAPMLVGSGTIADPLQTLAQRRPV